MAQKVQTILVDDIEGTEIKTGGETVTFALDSVTYEIDLSDKNAKKMREALHFYVDHGRRTGGRRSTSGRTSSAGRPSDQLRAVRDWAKANGHDVSDRGRVPRKVQEAYDTAH